MRKVLWQKIHTCKIKALSLLGWKLWPSLKFIKSRSRSQGKKLRYHVKHLVTKNIHVQYGSPIPSDKKVMAKVKVFQKWVKLQGQCHEVINYGTMWKVLSQGIHMCNMRDPSLLLWPRLKFSKVGQTSRSQGKKLWYHAKDHVTRKIHV